MFREGTTLDMNLSDILKDKKASILKKWFAVIVGSYHSGASRHLTPGGDAFTNPTGSTISRGIEDIFDELLKSHEASNPSLFLRDIVKIRAVQDLLPSQALSFFFSLKGIIREELRAEIDDHKLSHEILSLEHSIDSLTLSAFDIFMECREKLYEIKANEFRRASFRLIQKANKTDAAPMREPAGGQENNPKMKEAR
jgi:hypothetical protein